MRQTRLALLWIWGLDGELGGDDELDEHEQHVTHSRSIDSIAMENHHAINGKIHYFDWGIFNSYVKLPEGKSSIQLFPQLPQPQLVALDRGWAPNWSIATMSSPCSTRRSSPIPCCRGRWRSGTRWDVGLVGSMFHDQHGDLYGDLY